MSDHERTDVRVDRIPRLVIAFVLSLVVIHLAVWWMFRFYRGIDERQDVRRTLIEQPAAPPPEPRLQVSPDADLEQFRREQMQRLETYGWIAPDERRVRIPIERAMELASRSASEGKSQ